MALNRNRLNGLKVVNCKRGTGGARLGGACDFLSCIYFIVSIRCAGEMRGVGICPDRRAGTGAGDMKDVSIAKGANQFF